MKDASYFAVPTVQDDGDFLAVARCEDVVEEG
jgi:hypothetical protein